MKKSTTNDYFNYLEGKKVVIVGPASYLMKQGRGSEIDSHDIVIRVNHAIPIDHPEDYGTRTDVLYHAMTITALNKEPFGPSQDQVKSWGNAKISWFISALELNMPYVKKLSPYFEKASFNWAVVPKKFYEDVKAEIKSKLPSTGVLAITHLLKSEVSSLSIVGFDFYSSGIYSGYRGQESNPVNKWHDAHAQKTYMAKLIKNKRKTFNINPDYEFTKAIFPKRKHIKKKDFRIKTLQDLSQDIINNLYKIPHDIDLVIGIPRSGLMAGLIIANYLNIPCMDLNSFLQKIPPKCGRYKMKHAQQKIISKVLVVDDVIGSGTELRIAKEALNPFTGDYKFVYLVVYAHSNKFNSIDIYMEDCPTPRVFQWNLFNHPRYKICWDMDGVICRNPTKEEMNNKIKYEKFLRNADPMIIPTMPISCIISGRLAKYKYLTEKWLRQYNIAYKNLILLDAPRDHAIHKADNFKAVGGDIFIESNERQAIKIAQLTNKIVFCTENQQFYTGDD
jgi:hypoxanthine phosphoribosyltransferase